MDYSYDIMRMTKIRFYEWDRSELKFCCERMVRLRNLVRKSGPRGFRAVLFRMVPKPVFKAIELIPGFRAVLFRMVPKQTVTHSLEHTGFRAVLFRMVPKLHTLLIFAMTGFRAVLFRMVPKPS